MAKSRRVKHSKKSTRRAGAAKTRGKKTFSSVADACREIMKASKDVYAQKLHEQAVEAFPELSEVERTSLTLCLNFVEGSATRQDAERAIEDLEEAPSRPSTPESVETDLKTITPELSQEDMVMMDVDREPSPLLYRPIEVREGGPMELDGGRKRRKTRRGGRKHKSTRKH